MDFYFAYCYCARLTRLDYSLSILYTALMHYRMLLVAAGAAVIRCCHAGAAGAAMPVLPCRCCRYDYPSRDAYILVYVPFRHYAKDVEIYRGM